MAFAYSTFWICEMDFERVLLFKDPLTILYDPGITASQTGLTCPLFSHAFLHITMRHLSRFHKRTIMVRNLKRSQLNWSIAKKMQIYQFEKAVHACYNGHLFHQRIIKMSNHVSLKLIANNSARKYACINYT